jgi:hypothetical protein
MPNVRQLFDGCWMRYRVRLLAYAFVMPYIGALVMVSLYLSQGNMEDLIPVGLSTVHPAIAGTVIALVTWLFLSALPLLDPGMATAEGASLRAYSELDTEYKILCKQLMTLKQVNNLGKQLMTLKQVNNLETVDKSPTANERCRWELAYEAASGAAKSFEDILKQKGIR